MTQIRIGQNPDFDKKVAVEILCMLNSRNEQELSLFSYRDIIKELNKNGSLTREHPQGLFLASTGRSGYVYSILNALIDHELIKEVKGEGNAPSTHRNIYDLTPTGREITENPNDWEMPVLTKGHRPRT